MLWTVYTQMLMTDYYFQVCYLKYSENPEQHFLDSAGTSYVICGFFVSVIWPDTITQSPGLTQIIRMP